MLEIKDLFDLFKKQENEDKAQKRKKTGRPKGTEARHKDIRIF